MNGSCRRWCLTFAASACLVAVALAAEPNVASLIGDRSPTAILRTQPTATPPNLRFDSPHIDGYEVIGDPVAIPAKTAATLRALFSDPGAFVPAEKNYCAFRPGVAIRSGTEADAIDILVCFACDEAIVVPSGGTKAAQVSLTVSTRTALLTAARELLPSDEAIQNLPDTRRENPPPPPSVPGPTEPATE